MFVFTCTVLLAFIPFVSLQDIMVLGDSYAKKSWNLLATYCPGRSIRNYGVDNALASEWAKGSCPDKGMCSAPAVFNPVIGSGYKYAWLSVGGNDFIFEGCINFFGRLASTIKGAIEAVQAAGPTGMKILMTGYCIPPAPLTQIVCKNTNDISNLNGAIREACASVPSCTFVDATSACGGSASSYSNPVLFADYIHPNEQGYQKIFGMPGVQEFLGCGTSSDMCTDVRYPYYRNVNGFVVCYNALSLAQGEKGAPCDTWCTTDVNAGDNCNGCCGDMTQKLCFAQKASNPSASSSIMTTTRSGQLAASASFRAGAFPNNPSASVAIQVPSTPNGQAIQVPNNLNGGNRTNTSASEDGQMSRWVVIISAVAIAAIGFMCGTGIGSMLLRKPPETDSLSRSSSHQSLVEE